MKNIIFILTVLLIFSCSSDGNNYNNDLNGKWYPRETIVNGVSYLYDDHETCGKDYIQFYGNNSVKSIDIFDCESIVDWLGSYSLNENQLIITVDSTSRTFEIVLITNSELRIQYENDFDFDGDIETCIDVLKK